VTYVLDGSELVESQGVDRTQIIGGGMSASGMAAPPPPPPAPVSSGRSAVVSSGLTSWVKGLLWGYVGLLAAMMLSTVLIFVYFEQVESGNSGAFDSWDNWDTIFGVLSIISVLLSVPIFVLLIIWSYRAHAASESLQPGDRKWGRGWTIGAWFIPLASYILLPLILGEIKKIASATRIGGKADSDWPREPASAPLILWFVFYAFGGVIFWFGVTALDNAWDAGEYRSGLVMTLIGLALIGAASILGVAFVKDVSTKLSTDSVTNS
jgi:hypothetical protein